MNERTRAYHAQKTSVEWGKLVLCVAASMGLGFLSAWLGGAMNGYGAITISSFTPPFLVMAIVWPILYFTIGWSLYLVLHKSPANKRETALRNSSIAVWMVQMLVNLSWTFVMFRTQLYTFAFIWTAILAAFVTAQVVINFKYYAPSAVVLLPYLAWLILAVFSTLIIAIHN